MRLYNQHQHGNLCEMIQFIFVGLGVFYMMKHFGLFLMWLGGW